MLQFSFLRKSNEILLFLFFLIFFINLTIDDGINWSLNWLLAILFLMSLAISKKIYLPKTIAFTILVPFFSIYIVELIFHSNQISTDPIYNNELAPQITNNFVYILGLLCLPTILYTQKNLARNFVYLLNLIIIVSVLFNAYWNFSYDFNRGLLDEKLRPIILYDACMASFSLSVLALNFTSKHKSSYFFILLSLINLFLIIGHGSRGTWLAIPFILLLLGGFYYRTALKKVALTLGVSTLLTISLFHLPNNPIDQRIEAIQSDTSLLENSNYHSSIGTRIFLWNLAVEQFKSSPIYGVGTKQFRDKICEQHQQGFIPNCQVHAHNVFFQFLATHGIIGFLGIFLTFLIPFSFYVKTLFNNTSQESKVFAIAGLCFTISMGACGLTDFLFFTPFPTMLYFLMSVTLITIITKQRTFSPKI